MALEVGGSSPLGHPIRFGRIGQHFFLSFAVLRPGLIVVTTKLRPEIERASSSMAEQRTLNPQVLGSNPRGRTSSEAESVICPKFWRLEASELRF